MQIDPGDIVRCRRRNFNVEFSPGPWVLVCSYEFYDNNYLALHLIAGNNIVYLEDMYNQCKSSKIKIVVFAPLYTPSPSDRLRADS